MVGEHIWLPAQLRHHDADGDESRNAVGPSPGPASNGNADNRRDQNERHEREKAFRREEADDLVQGPWISGAELPDSMPGDVGQLAGSGSGPGRAASDRSPPASA